MRGARRADSVATDRIGEADRVAAVGQRLVAGREKLQVRCYRLASGGPAANNSRAAASGGCQACVQPWSEVGAPVRPVLPTPWTLKLSASPTSPRSLPALTTTLVRAAGTESSGAWPTKPVVHEVPITFHVAAGTLHSARCKGPTRLPRRRGRRSSS